MISVLAATATELAELKPIRRGLFILGRYVVAALAYTTLKNNIVARHLATSNFRLLLPIKFPTKQFSRVLTLKFPISNLRSAI
jgi:hypothetical protein